MKLTQEQIQQLYAFTVKHYVEHYDLQTELVDHLANGIEQQIQEKPEVTFKQALNKEFRKFGVHGFEDVITKRKRAMALKYLKIIFGFFKSYFSYPKVLATVTTIITVAVIFWNIEVDYKQDIIFGIYAVIMLAIMFFAIKMKFKKTLKANSKKWMLKEQIYDMGTIISFLNLLQILFIRPNIFGLNLELEQSNFYIDVFFAFIIVSVLLIGYIIIKIIPQKAEELLTKTYPEYKFF